MYTAMQSISGLSPSKTAITNTAKFKPLIHIISLFTVKDGLVFIEAYGADDAMAQSKGSSQYVFADVNGDDWFYFEDSSTEDLKESCTKTKTASTFTARTISGSDTTLVNFAYDRTPKHRVLHEGRCNFAGLTPVPNALRDDADFKEFRVQQELR